MKPLFPDYSQKHSIMEKEHNSGSSYQRTKINIVVVISENIIMPLSNKAAFSL